MTKFLSPIVGALSLILAGPAAAGVVLDQATIPETGHVDFAGAGWSISQSALAQSFTVGVSGLLDHVSLGVEAWPSSSAGDFQFQVLNGSNQVLYSQTVSGADLPHLEFSGLDWDQTYTTSVRSADINVLVGEVYLLKVFAVAGGGGGVWRASTNAGVIDYPGGQAYEYDIPGFPNPFEIGNEFAFRTYVDTGGGAVPEPATWAFMVMGFGLAGWSLRRKAVAVA
jgi:hypothetical protein